MLRTVKQLGVRLAVELPGWLFLLSGMALVGFGMLVPVRHDLQQLQWRCELMRLQAQQLQHQETEYKQFHLALATDDPTVLERLAYYQFHLKPTGAQAFRATPDRSLLAAGSGQSDAMSADPPPWLQTPTLESMLHQPLPRLNRSRQLPESMQSRLVRLTSGHTRPAMLGSGLACICVGMLLPIRATTRRRGNTRRAKRTRRGA